MNRTLIFILCIFSKIAFSQPNNAHQINNNQTFCFNYLFADKIERAKLLLADTIRTNNIPGLSIAVAKNDTILWAQGFGYADLENKTLIKVTSKFRIGSVSKTLTATAIGKLLDEEILNLSDNFRTYVPYYPNIKSEVSIAQLAAHLSGIRDYDHSKNEYLSNVNYNSIHESIATFKDDSLLFDPGTNYLYSSYNYTLLSAVIEGATSKPFLDYMKENIITPLGLFNTIPDYHYYIIDDRVRFYDNYNGAIINSPSVDNSNKWAGGGYLSTPMDLVKMCQRLLKNDFISESTKKQLWTSAAIQSGEPINYGIGWRISQDKQENTLVYHGGNAVGGRSFLLMYPEEGFIIAISCNLGNGFNEDLAFKILDIFRQ